MSEPLRVRVHYDFASTLCYVAHRLMQRMAGELGDLDLELAWTPVDLTRLVGPWRRGAPVSEDRRANAARVAEELGVDVRVPALWPDSRAAGAGAILADAAGRGETWRERAFSAFFEEGHAAPAPSQVMVWAEELGLAWDEAALREAEAEVARRTEEAREEMVTGVPTFMLGSWPFGGIQTEPTMRHVLQRFARRARRGAVS